MNIKDNSTIFIILGDSHATHLYPMIKNSSIIDNFYIQTFNGCFFVADLISYPPKVNWSNKKKLSCQDYIYQETKRINDYFKNKFDEVFVLIASRYTVYPTVSTIADAQLNIIKNQNNIFEKFENNMLNYFNKFNDDKINFVIFSPLPEFYHYPYSCFLNNKMCYNDYNLEQKRLNYTVKVLGKLSEEIDFLRVFDPYKVICPNIKKCSMYDDINKILYYIDRDHLSVEGSSYLSKSFDQWLRENY